MNKRWKCVFALLTTTLLTACAYSRFDGSRTGNVDIVLSEEEEENVSLPDMQENDAESFTEEHCESITIADQEVICSEFDIDLTEDETTFLTLEVTEDTEATAHYSYTTREKEGAVWGYYVSGSEEKTAFELRAGTESVYDMFWTDKTIALKRGTNIFYISGDDVSCKMHFELPKIDKSKVSYVGAYTKEEAQEKVRGKNIADTFGITISLPENRKWIVDREYHLSDENNLTIAYYDSVADADCTILVSKNENLTLPEIEYDEMLNESWEGKTAANQNIMVKVQHGKNDNKAVLATWEYEDYQFAIIGEGEKGSDSISKTALCIINNLN